MASRAVRKLLREQELQKQQMAATDANQDQEAEAETSDDEETTETKPRNVFDMLNAFEAAAETEQSEDEEEDAVSPAGEPLPTTTQTSKSKKKKKKAKKKAKAKAAKPHESDSEDEIDRALKALAVEDKGRYQDASVQASSWEATATGLLAPDTKYMNPTNEMRSLFGSIAIETSNNTAPNRPQRRREVNLQGGVDLATALSGRHCIGSRGKELGSLATRRNCFVQGRTEWPLATSGGLSMESVPSDGFEKRYNLIHNRNYQELQQHFRQAVETMQPEAMIGMLSTNPYHLASLLQVSEIAKHQGDHSLSGDLLERALFTVGRSVHSSFPAALREGTARLDFNKTANRELYLAVWRHIRNLEQKGTWRTVYEWSKILLQFDTTSDPYGVTLIIDQAALRGRQHEQFLELASEEGYGNAWRHLPNIQISLALAYLRKQEPKKARRQLAIAMHHYPYILSALASALEISPMPKSLWAKVPSTDAERLYTELYVLRAKDLWNTPETIALIGEVAETLEFYSEAISSSIAAPKLEVSLEEARHIMLLETPALIALLPRQFRNMPTSASDVLPPPSTNSELTNRAPTTAASNGSNVMQAIFSAAGNAAGAPMQGVNGMLQQILNWFHAPAGPTQEATGEGEESQGQAAFRAIRDDLVASNPGQNITDEMVEAFIRNQLSIHEEPITAEGLGMVGGWDYYAERAEATSEDDDDSMPELETITDRTPTEQSLQTPTNPHAATVEEADSDEEPSRATPAATRFVLRSVDSDEEDQATGQTNQRSHPEPTHILYASTSQTSPSRAQASSTDATPSDPDPDNQVLNSNDSQRVQRYLLTMGLSSLKAKPDMLPHYLQRLRVLPERQQNWIINMISQRGSEEKEIAERLKSAL